MRNPVLWRIAIIAGLVILLEVLCLTGVIDKLTMQPPHRIVIDLVLMLAAGTLNGAIAKTLGNALIAFIIAMVLGIASAIRHPPPAAGARHAGAAVRHLLRDPGVRLLSDADHPVRPRRCAADLHRRHARRGRGDREHAERARPGAERAAQDREDQSDGAGRDRAARHAALRLALYPHRRQARRRLFADRHHRRRVHHVQWRHGLRDQLRLQQFRQCGDVSADPSDPHRLDQHQHGDRALGEGADGATGLR